MNCPKCGLKAERVTTLLLCTNCGLQDVSEERLKEAKAVDFKCRSVAASIIFIVIVFFIFLMRINPEFIKSYPSSEYLLVYFILTFAIGTQIYISLMMKKNFPEVKIE